ncbi:hypothetical protein A7982_12319 [Minicystis rosea]|nr:hypothetical protein A7982_12319 [Minicystis rosea]
MGSLPHRTPRLAKMLLFVIAGLYAFLCAAGCLAYRAVLYPAPHDDAAVPPPGAVLREIHASDGITVPAIHFPAPPDAPTVVHFHGNAETLRTEMSFGLALRRRGLGVLLVEYRGYGSAPGSPSEAGFYRDAEAALSMLAAEGVPRERVVLSGISLGTGVASEMAARGLGAGLVLIAPYTSIPRVAGRIVPILPTSILIGDRFDTLGKAAKITVPTLVIHGDLDQVIPYDMGQTLAKAIPSAKLVTVEGGHHNDVFAVRPDLFDVIAAHAKGIMPR